MSGLINKVKDALHSDKDKHNDARSDNYGPHSSNAANYADPRVDSDRSNVHHNTGHSNVGTTGGAYGAPGGGYGDNTTAGYGGSTTAGPHGSNIANKVDPRVDSDLDGSRRVGGGGYGDNTTGGYGTGAQTGYGGSTTAGPHSSNLANQADPRVDSDLDGSRRVGGAGYGSGNTVGGYGSGNTVAHDATTTGGAYGSSSTNAGPHNSNLANKLDPRVDSDRDNRNDPTSRVGGYGTQDNYGVSGSNPTPSGGNTGYGNTGVGHGNTGYGNTGVGHGNTGYDNTGIGHGNSGIGGTTGTTGYGEPGYNAGAGNTGYGNTGVGGNQYGSSATPGSGNAATTAGPHNSNLLNKLDPRVDSDLDGSKTYGGNQTHR